MAGKHVIHHHPGGAATHVMSVPKKEGQMDGDMDLGSNRWADEKTVEPHTIVGQNPEHSAAIVKAAGENWDHKGGGVDKAALESALQDWEGSKEDEQADMHAAFAKAAEKGNKELEAEKGRKK
jgi:hypothetical protein